MNVFVSWCDDGGDVAAREFVARLREVGAEVETSPAPGGSIDQDPKWEHWYGKGLPAAVARCDAFVAAVTSYYYSATWMAVEFDAAFKEHNQRGRPLLFVLKLIPEKTAAGFQRYETAATKLSAEPVAATMHVIEAVRKLPAETPTTLAETAREVFFGRMRDLPPAKALVVILDPSGIHRSLGREAALIHTRSLAHRCPQAEAICRFGWAAFGIISNSPKADLLRWAAEVIGEVPEPICVGVGLAGAKPLDSFYVLELGTNEAAVAELRARVFTLDEAKAWVFPFRGG